MIFFKHLILSFVTLVPACLSYGTPFRNSTFDNPILPGFHPDPSCIFVKEWDNTFFCASSSFSVAPGVPVHASKDLQNWKLISNALNRKEQLPTLTITNGSTSGIWAPAIRYHDGTFYILTTLVFDKEPQTNLSRWDNIILKSKNPYDASSWSIAVHFNFTGYDTSPYWHENGKIYVTGSHPWNLQPGINMVTVDLDTGKVDNDLINIWNGTGGLAPEGPHHYKKDGWYYLMIAEGGTGLNHMETIARAKKIEGPYDPYPRNPILTNANTSQYFQTVGHADLFQDASSNWWGVALSTRSGPRYITYPMGRETVLYPVTWKTGDWPVDSAVRGEMSSWPLPPVDRNLGGSGPFIKDPDNIDFKPGSKLPAHFVHWRWPIDSNYAISPPGHANALRLTSSKLNLTALDGNYAGPDGQTFVGRRQVDTLFTYSVVMDFTPEVENMEAGVTVFLTQNHHIELGVTMLSTNGSLAPHFTWRAVSQIATPDPITTPVPTNWTGKPLAMEIKAFNLTHYSFSAGPADAMSMMQTIGYGNASLVSYGFTGTLVGVYATSNGGDSTEDAYFSNWRYYGLGQFIN